eukprot:366378-Chlamydomonas_euryale.AAC.4
MAACALAGATSCARSWAARRTPSPRRPSLPTTTAESASAAVAVLAAPAPGRPPPLTATAKTTGPKTCAAPPPPPRPRCHHFAAAGWRPPSRCLPAAAPAAARPCRLRRWQRWARSRKRRYPPVHGRVGRQRQAGGFVLGRVLSDFL